MAGNGEACASLDKMVISGKTLYTMDTHIFPESRYSGVK
jgi:hypothetical protein